MKPCIGCGKTPTCYIAECSTVYCTVCINGILDAVHGMSPQGVAAIMEAVREARHNQEMRRFDCSESTKAMSTAIALLPKEGG